LKRAGVAFIYITHKMSEVFEIADRAFIMRMVKRLGKFRFPMQMRAISSPRWWDGKFRIYTKSNHKIEQKDIILKVQKLTFQGKFEEIGFELNRGEIIGFAGLVGAGRTEMALSLFGAAAKTRGKLRSMERKEV
jgi:ABC-type sugar transport system ATPase subunit